MLIFGSEEGLRHTCRSKVWFMDGCFSSAPKLFEQIYLIRCPLGTSAVSCVYGFLNGKSQVIYEEFLQAVVTTCDSNGYTPDPDKVMMDFEKAMINSVTTILGEHVQFQGCFYHLTQCTWRKIQTLGLVELYKSDSEIRNYCCMLDALAFLPIDNVNEGMNYLLDSAPAVLQPLMDYFNSTFVSGSYRKVKVPAATPDELPVMELRHIAPLFPPPLWNVNSATLTGGDRTNNLCESWNSSFNKLVGFHRASIWVVIDATRKDAAMVSTLLLKESRGEPPKKRVKKAVKDHQERLKNLWLSFNSSEKSIEELLSGVGHVIRL